MISPTPLSNPHPQILWRQVWGLSALLAAILISFIAYGFYQATILRGLGFVNLADWLGIFQGLLGAMVEPLVGRMSDSILKRFGSRLPQISAGITLAGLLFVVLGLLLADKLPAGLLWLVPVVMTAWVIAMIIFRGPAIALLRQFAPTAALPQANAVMIVVLGLVGASAPLIEMLLAFLGSSPTFVLGAIILVFGAIAFYASLPQHSLNLEAQEVPWPIPRSSILGLFCVGIGAGIEINLMLNIVPKVLSININSVLTPWITSLILLICALTAVPVGKWATNLGIEKAFSLGLGAIAFLMFLALFNDSFLVAIGLIGAFGLALALVAIEQIPFALSVLPPSLAGLGTGLYFGGIAAGGAVAALLLKFLSPLFSGVAAAIAFILTLFCIFLNPSDEP